MDFNAIRACVACDLQRVDHLIQERLHTDITLVRELGFYIINSGGKRIRPLLALLVGRLIGLEEAARCQLAVILEFIHTATLLHDDVVDESHLRRGQKTANALFGNAASVLVGDFLYTRAFQMMTELQCAPVMDIMADATNKIAEGEVLQLMNCGDPDVTQACYFQIIYCKTAKLFEAACHTPAAMMALNQEQTQALCAYGLYLGTAFQLVDDVIDYTGDTQTMGKNLGDDLTEGKPTLPIIYALAHASFEEKQFLRQTIVQGNRGEPVDVDRVIGLLKQTQALDFCAQSAREEAQKAVAELSQAFAPCPMRDALCALADLAAQRRQ